jgi:hypothetical protein
LALVLLPHYWTTLVAYHDRGLPTQVLSFAWFAPPVVGSVVLTCGVGLPLALAVCFLTGRRGVLWLIYLLTILGSILTSSLHTELMSHAVNVLMAVVALLATLFLAHLWSWRPPFLLAFRTVAASLTAVVLLFSLQSFVVGLGDPASFGPQLTKYRHRSSPSGLELVRWVRENTGANQVVSLVQDNRVVLEPMFGRVACAVGPDVLGGGLDSLFDESRVPGYLRAHPNLQSAILESDFVVVSREPMGLNWLKAPTLHYAEHRQMIQDLGFTIVFENGIGFVAAHPAQRGSEASQVRFPRLKWRRLGTWLAKKSA